MSDPSELERAAQRLATVAAELDADDLTQEARLALAEEAVALSETLTQLIAEELRRAEA